MNIVIEVLKEEHVDEYDQMLGRIETTLLYSSYMYCRFLKRLLKSSEPIYLVAREAGHLIGVLPAFIFHNSKYGNVLNSLPFYGSYGGISVSSRVECRSKVKQALLAAFHELAEEKRVIVSTLISSPLEEETSFYEAEFGHTLRDQRLGQLTPLPTGWQSQDELQTQLMTSFHSKTRNCIRKAEKSDLTVYHSDSIEHLEKLSSLHEQNLRAIGGLAKTWRVFAILRETFVYDRDYRVYVAEKDGNVIAALLVFFYNRTAEYFTPATAEGYRGYQPMSLLVYEAMQEAARRGCKWWNWGGTWLTQTGVYHFKARWGTKDYPYFYYTREYVTPSPLRQLTAEEIVSEYPYYYVLPFNHLGVEKS